MMKQKQLINLFNSDQFESFSSKINLDNPLIFSKKLFNLLQLEKKLLKEFYFSSNLFKQRAFRKKIFKNFYKRKQFFNYQNLFLLKLNFKLVFFKSLLIKKRFKSFFNEKGFYLTDQLNSNFNLFLQNNQPERSVDNQNNNADNLILFKLKTPLKKNLIFFKPRYQYWYFNYFLIKTNKKYFYSFSIKDFFYNYMFLVLMC